MAEAWGRRYSVWAVLLLILLIAAPAARAQTRAAIPSFGVDVEVVSLNLAVTDPHGRPVDDLTAQDVAVYEDGALQPISVFTQETWPITLSVLIDGSDSMRPVLPLAQSAAKRLLATLGPRDRASVARFSKRLEVLQDLTSDRPALEAAVDAVRGDGVTALYDALYVALKDLAAQRREDGMERRALVVLSDGSDTASMIRDEQVLETAREAEVTIYAVGLQNARPRTGLLEDPLPTYFLTALARETGGRVYFPSALAELEGTYAQIATELRTLYGVAYTSANSHQGDGWRRIHVQALRPNLLIRHRTGYYASAVSRLAARR